MAKLKLVPKIIIAAAIAGGVYYGADKFISSGKLQKTVAAQQAADAQAVQPAEYQAPAAEPAPVETVQQQPQPAPQMPAPEPADSGMAKLLQSGRK